VNARWGVSEGGHALLASGCGLAPKPVGLLMNLRAFVDESCDAAVFSLAGYVSSIDRWRQFSIEWEKLLPFAVLNERGTYQFKMAEMALNEERMARVPAFYRVIEKYVAFAISVQFRIETVHAAMRRITVPGVRIDWRGWKNPYLLAFRALTDVINMRRADLGPIIHADEKIDFIFDQRSEERQVRRAWKAVESGLPPEKSVLYGALRFSNDEEYLPLQAADLWAWWVRKWEAEFGDQGIAKGQFPWESTSDQPPKLIVTFDEDGLIEYLLDKARLKLPQGKSFVILPKGMG
jgi:uncharacterized protein DUF3800